MAGRHLDTDALSRLIKAVQNYQVSLDDNRKILTNAANVCDQAMGHDAISQKHIAKLNEALEELKKTSKLVEDVAVALQKDYDKATQVVAD